MFVENQGEANEVSHVDLPRAVPSSIWPHIFIEDLRHLSSNFLLQSLFHSVQQLPRTVVESDPALKTRFMSNMNLQYADVPTELGRPMQMQEEPIIVRAKPRNFNANGVFHLEWPAVFREESILVNVAPIRRASEGERLSGLIQLLTDSFELNHSLYEAITIRNIVAMWGGQNGGGFSFSIVRERNVLHILDMVAKGAPWAYLAFDFEEKK